MEAAANDAGWKVRRLRSWSPPLDLRGSSVAVYGEPLLCALLAQELDLLLVEPQFDWLARLSATWIQRDVEFATLDQARRIEGSRFVKPCDDKCFSAKVYGPGEIATLPESLPGSTPVLIAEPVVWTREFRAFILEGEMATVSQYAEHGELAVGDATRAAAEFVDRFLEAGLALPPAFALDVGLIEGRGGAVVEANPVWGSGIYACDARRVLDVLRRACLLRGDLGAADMQWIVERQA